MKIQADPQYPGLAQERPVSAPLTKSKFVLKSVSYILSESLEPNYLLESAGLKISIQK